MSITSNSRPPGWLRVAVPQGDDAALLLRVEQDQRTIAADAAAMADDVVPGIIVASPAIAVVGLAEPLEELAQAAALARRLHAAAHGSCRARSATARRGISPICAIIHSDMSLMLLLTPPAAGTL